MRVLVVWWIHAQGTLAGGVEGLGHEAGDLPLYLAGDLIHGTGIVHGVRQIAPHGLVQGGHGLAG